MVKQEVSPSDPSPTISEDQQILANKLTQIESQLNAQSQSNQIQSTVIAAIESLTERLTLAVEKSGHINQKSISTEFADTLRDTFSPLVRMMGGKLDLDLNTNNKMNEINEKLDFIEKITVANKVIVRKSSTRSASPTREPKR